MNSGFQLQEMKGSLFMNDRKENPNQVDVQGTVKINGVEYRIAGWLSDKQPGGNFKLNGPLGVRQGTHINLDIQPVNNTAQHQGGGYSQGQQQQSSGGFNQGQQQQQAAPVNNAGGEDIPF